MPFSADAVVHAAYERTFVREQLGAATGIAGAAALSGTELRGLIRSAVSGNSALRARIEAILHPIVREELERAKVSTEQAGKVLLAEIPLYYETGGAVLAERVIVVAASQVTQLLRLQSSRSLDQRTAENMLKMQLPLEHKIERADTIIWNDGSGGALEGQAETLLCQDKY